MDEAHKKKLASIKREIEQGKYRIEERAVADAIMRRLRELALAWGKNQISLS